MKVHSRILLPVILIHAAGGAARNFGSVTRRLEGARAIDLPGHGRAGGEAPRSLEESARFVLAASPPGPLLLCGHSMGGMVALTAAALAPERTAGVVLIATGARPTLGRALADKARNDFEGFLAALAATGSPLMTIEAIREVGSETIARDIEACIPWDGIAAAARVHAPALLLAGSRDRIAPPRLVRELADALPGSRSVVLEGAGHVLPVERPEEVAREIDRFRTEIARRYGGAAKSR